ncbi:glycosyltransferase [Xanthobacter sediminis]|uniref:glycosyltransferase n=1 Tax=Xanthobacter sediminis TaxID=3119926 RepID=UPI00372C9DDE
MRIAILSSSYLPVLDGVAVSVHERAARLAAAGHAVLLLAPRPGREIPPGLVPPGVVHVPLSSAPFGTVPADRNPVRAAQGEIWRALAAFRPDVIHVDEPDRLALGLMRVPARAFARRHGVPLIAFFHTPFVDYVVGERHPRWLSALGWQAVATLFNRYDATLVPGAAMLRRLEGAGLVNGVCGPFNGADTSLFTPGLRRAGYWRQEWGLPALDARFVLLVVGRLTPDKGWAQWAQALPRLGRLLGDALAVVVAGEGELRPQVEAMLAQGLAHGHLLGAVPRVRMPALLANGDACATLSRHENASLAVLEAQASALPVLAPRAGGLPDQIADGETGLLFSPHDTGGLVAAVARLVREETLRARLREGLMARRAVIGWDTAFAAWLGAVEAVVARARR